MIPLLSGHMISERFRDEVHDEVLYKSIFTFTLLGKGMQSAVGFPLSNCSYSDGKHLLNMPLVLVVVVQIYLNNHLKLTIYYNAERMSSGKGMTPATTEVCRIVAFEVYPQRFGLADSLIIELVDEAVDVQKKVAPTKYT